MIAVECRRLYAKMSAPPHNKTKHIRKSHKKRSNIHISTSIHGILVLCYGIHGILVLCYERRPPFPHFRNRNTWIIGYENRYHCVILIVKWPPNEATISEIVTTEIWR